MGNDNINTNKIRNQKASGEVFSDASKISIFMTNSYFPQSIQDSDPKEKKTLAKQSEFSLIRADKIFMLSFMTFWTCLMKGDVMISGDVVLHVFKHLSNTGI